MIDEIIEMEEGTAIIEASTETIRQDGEDTLK